MNSNIFVELASSTQKALNKTDFDYPLLCNFEIHGYDSSKNGYSLIYCRSINVQRCGLTKGLNLILNKLIWKTNNYSLYMTAEDSEKIRFKSIGSITLDHQGLVQPENAKHLNTLLLELDQ